MQKAKCQNKSKTKKSATIYISGITNSHEAFINVTPKQFLVALAHLGLPIEKDSRLKERKGLETYYIPKDCLERLRDYGIWTPLVGYSCYNQYFVHYIAYQLIKNIIRHIEKYDIEVIKKNLHIRELIPIKVKRYNVKKN